MMHLTDSRGRESTTLAFVALSWLAVTGMFLWKGNASNIAEYGAAVAAILAIWLGREWTEKRIAPTGGTNG